MKRIFHVIIILICSLNNIYSQNAAYVKGKSYEGFIFPKEALLGYPSDKYRYTPSFKDIAMAEKILGEYVKSNKNRQIELPKNRRTLKKFTRQYFGCLSSSNEIIIRINLFDMRKLEDGQSPSTEIIPLLGYCCIQINITTKKIGQWEEIR